MKAAVEEFQTAFHIEVTGVIDETTWSILFDPDPQPIVDENDDKPGEEDPTDADPDKEKTTAISRRRRMPT